MNFAQRMAVRFLVLVALGIVFIGFMSYVEAL